MSLSNFQFSTPKPGLRGRICAFNRSWVHRRSRGRKHGVMSVTSPEGVQRGGAPGHVFIGSVFGPACTTRPTDQGQFYELLHIVLVVLLYVGAVAKPAVFP